MSTCQPSMHKAFGSTSRAEKKKKEREGEGDGERTLIQYVWVINAFRLF